VITPVLPTTGVNIGRRSGVNFARRLTLIGFGALVLLTAWLPMLLKELPLSLPIVCVGMGALIFAWPETPGIAPRPQDYLVLTERLTEFVVIIALVGAGLKLDRPLAFATSSSAQRI